LLTNVTHQACPNLFCRRFVSIVSFIVLLLVAFGSATSLRAQSAGFSAGKKLCIGDPATMTAPESCIDQSPVTNNIAVYYVITVTNPPGEFAKSVKIDDNFPVTLPNFQQQGAIFCRDETGTPVPVSISGPPVGTITLNANTTVHCFLPGKFVGATSVQSNTATLTNKDGGGSVNATVNTVVTAFDPVPTDIALTKSASVTTLNVSGGPATMTWTVTVKNNGPTDVDMGQWFKLHDVMALKPLSVPFKVTLVSATCTPFTPLGAAMATDCLNLAGPVPAGPMPMLIGTMAPKAFFTWGYAGSGKLPVGGMMTLTIVTKIEELPSLNCYIQPASDGIRNTVFFTLTNPNGTAKSDTIPGNNTALAQVALVTGNSVQADDCGKGHLKITKKQISPTGLAAWGPLVTYEIEIVNQSLPAQAITIGAANLEDWVTQGIGTPPFTRVNAGVVCMSTSSSAGICTQFAPGAAPLTGSYSYSFYGQSNKAWASLPGSTFTLPALPPGQKIVLRSRFNYINPDCQTVPNVQPKLIRNTAVVRYKATAYGASSASPQNENFQQSADMDTKMAMPQPCKFVVTKQQISPPGPVPFGSDMTYKVTFTNNGNDRSVGTVGDFVRITQPGYQTALGFSSNWLCTSSTPGAVTGFAPVGSVSSGSTLHTASPAQGAAAVNLRANAAVPLFFKSGATLTCTVRIKVQRPPYGSNLCSADPTEFENMALMDVTHPFNTNVPWPVSGGYTSALGTTGPQPTPLTLQTLNWASVRTSLPKCFDATVNKVATVAGLPGWSQPWTYVGGPAIDYAVTVENGGTSSLTGIQSGTTWNGLAVADGIAGGVAGAGTPLCAPSSWCSVPPFNTPVTEIGVASLGPKGNATAKGVWKLTASGPFTGVEVRNCAKVYPTGDRTGPGWYPNYDPSVPAPNARNLCVKVPVVKVTSFQVLKAVLDATGAGVEIAGPFTINVACTPHALPIATATFPLTTLSGGISVAHTVQNVPTTSICTISEPGLASVPVPGLAIEKCIQQHGQGSTAEWSSMILPSVFPNLFNTSLIQVRNTLTCKKPVVATKLTIEKQFVNPFQPNGTPLPPQTFNFTVACLPTATPSGVPITTVGTAVGSAMVVVPVGASCTVTEPAPPVPPALANACAPPSTAGWQATPPQSLIIPASGASVTFINRWQCAVP
jgi:Domain of unknown function (DUF5979)